MRPSVLFKKHYKQPVISEIVRNRAYIRYVFLFLLICLSFYIFFLFVALSFLASGQGHCPSQRRIQPTKHTERVPNPLMQQYDGGKREKK